MMKILEIFTVLLILNLTLVSAQTLRVTKPVPEEIRLGDVLEVNIIIENLENRRIDIYVKEMIGNAEPIDPPELNQPSSPTGCKYCMPPPYYSWDMTLQSEETRTIVYKIKPVHPGEFLFSRTIVTTSDGETYYSNLAITYVRCNENGVCEKDLVENYFNCPEDCSSGSEDNVCDLIEDGVCDPDCFEGVDPDCVDQEPVIEPQDWQKWIYINFKEDEQGRITIEDVMTSIELPTIPQPPGDYYLEFIMENGTVIKKGNFDITKGKIVLEYSEDIEDLVVKKDNEELLRFDLKQVLCNHDGVCDDSENFFSCPDDCISGSDDGVCDGIKDGIIDPDCRRQKKLELDPDYSKPKWWKWPAIAVGLVLLIVIGVIVMFWRERE